MKNVAFPESDAKAHAKTEYIWPRAPEPELCGPRIAKMTDTKVYMGPHYNHCPPTIRILLRLWDKRVVDPCAYTRESTNHMRAHV